jgi:hypothetical protein
LPKIIMSKVILMVIMTALEVILIISRNYNEERGYAAK